MPRTKKIITTLLLVIGFLSAVTIGFTLGFALAATRNIQNLENLQEHKPALPTKILDRNGRLITQFFSEEKREIVSIDEIPKFLINALLTREDQHFYDHHGFRVMYILGAAWDIITGRSFRGGSTLTQQLAGHLYADRSDISLKRKMVELWWAIQMERQLTKNEILERYLNLMYFGHNTYGVETASQFYFNRSVQNITLAESTMLIIQLANPGRYSPINHPNRARKLQREILDQMVKLGYADEAEADYSFYEYWDNYDYTRSNRTSAWFEREDKAPYFSEYVRQRLEEEFLGSMDLYKEGLVVHTTLDLESQEIADLVMSKWIKWVNDQHQLQAIVRVQYADSTFLPIVDLLSLTFNIEGIRFAGNKQKEQAKSKYLKELNPVLDTFASMFGIDDLKYASRIAYNKEAGRSKKTRVEGALISIGSQSGHIMAMVGGRKFEPTNQFNRAAQARIQPGSAFKPLYYSAAISSRMLTPATMIVDAPMVFWNDDGTPYIPLNYRGEWKGRVLLRRALSKSMNVPSMKVLDAVGFDAVITRSSRMLGITEPEEIERVFPRKYPLGLGIITVSPLQMARAFATFPNQGRAVEPLAIRYVEDRNGKIILELEKELRARQMRTGDSLQIMSPQEAYIMTSMLKTTVDSGTLRGARQSIGGFGRPMAGKTGTIQNWATAWTIGFSPQLTTAIYFGFDWLGYSLGVNLTGATIGGPAWAEYMKEVHADLPVEEFIKPDTGLIEATVCAVSGLLPTRYCNEGVVKEIFLTGTEPREFCDYHKYKFERDLVMRENIKSSILLEHLQSEDIILPGMEDIFLEELEETSRGDESELINPLLD
ncbi:Penicillin-binding protein 1A [subsurface metagenome]